MTMPNLFRYAMYLANTHDAFLVLAFWRAALLDPQATREWVAFVTARASPELRDHLVLRPHRRYMRNDFDIEQRRALLREHYTTLRRYFAPDPRLMEEGPGLMVATLGDAGCTVHVGGNRSQEGEMAFRLRDREGHCLATMAASIGRDDEGNSILWIGGLHGAAPPLGRDTAHELAGLDPKETVVLAAQTFAQMLGLVALRAPGKERHLARRGLRRLRPMRRHNANYGAFWETLGGTEITRGEYTVPVTPPLLSSSRESGDATIRDALMSQTRQALAGLTGA